MSPRSTSGWCASLAGAACLLTLAACSKPASTEVEVEIRSVGVDRMSHSPVVVLQDKEHRTGIPIWIGPGEAQAIAMQLEGVNPPRPMTHDLMKEILVRSGVDLDHIVIGDLKDRTYFATIHLKADGRGVEVDSRPSDAIALAVRFKKPIFVARTLLDGESAIDIQKIFGSDTLEFRGVTVQAVSGDLADALHLDSADGVLVAELAEDVDGLQRGDLIVAVNGEPVHGLSHFAEITNDLGTADAALAVDRAGERLEVPLPAR